MEAFQKAKVDQFTLVPYTHAGMSQVLIIGSDNSR